MLRTWRHQRIVSSSTWDNVSILEFVNIPVNEVEIDRIQVCVSWPRQHHLGVACFLGDVAPVCITCWTQHVCMLVLADTLQPSGGCARVQHMFMCGRYSGDKLVTSSVFLLPYLRLIYSQCIVLKLLHGLPADIWHGCVDFQCCDAIAVSAPSPERWLCRHWLCTHVHTLWPVWHVWHNFRLQMWRT